MFTYIYRKIKELIKKYNLKKKYKNLTINMALRFPYFVFSLSFVVSMCLCALIISFTYSYYFPTEPHHYKI